MTNYTKIFCIGTVGWDFIGKTPEMMKVGIDIPGDIEVKIGGVAANIAIALADSMPIDSTLEIGLVSCVGNDLKSSLLLDSLKKKNIDCKNILKKEGSCDTYIGIESKGSLFGAIASSKQLEKSGIELLQLFENKELSKNTDQLSKHIIVDSNLSVEALNYLGNSICFDTKNFILVSASPYKAKKMRSLISKRNVTIYLNLEEASSLLDKEFTCSSEAANYLYKIGAKEVIVTNGAKKASSRCQSGLATISPSKIINMDATGAGDTFLAAHLLSKIINPSYCPTKHLEIAELAARKKISR